ncbi:hypothetical protein E3226_005705 [Legionella geestiana]|uniref:hypothetical protein n=1 Tax=Legionella geestiana TaxID=45065 RepID=UPI0010923516|nr:hypothetical protein [Legionella geestiana]QDQ39928.1 hypothetical protein E3226_005705 [Legionella geestiana]
MYGIFGSTAAINDYFGRDVMNLTARSCGLTISEVSPVEYSQTQPSNGTLEFIQTPEGICYKFTTGSSEGPLLTEGRVEYEHLGIQAKRKEDQSYEILSVPDCALLSDYIHRTHGLSPNDQQIRADLEKRTPFLATPNEMQHLLNSWLACPPSSYVQGMPDARVLMPVVLGLFPLINNENELQSFFGKGGLPTKDLSFAYLNANQELCGFALYWREDKSQWAILHSANTNAAPEERRQSVVVSAATLEAPNSSNQLVQIGGLAALEHLRAEIGPAPLVQLFLEELFDEEYAVRPEVVERWSSMRVNSLNDSGSGKVWTDAYTQDFSGFVDGVRSLFGDSSGVTFSSSSSSSSASSSSVSAIDVPLDGTQSAMLCHLGLQKLGQSERFAALGENHHAVWAYLLHAPRFAGILRDVLAMQDVQARNALADALASPDNVTSKTLLNLHAVGVSTSDLMQTLDFFSENNATSENICEQRRQVLQFLAALEYRLNGFLEPSVFAVFYQLLPTFNEIAQRESGQVWLKNNLLHIHRYVLSEDKQKGLLTLLEAFLTVPSENSEADESVAPEFITIGKTVYSALLVAMNTDDTFSLHQGQVAARALQWLESQNVPDKLQLAHTIVAGTPAGIPVIPTAALRLLVRFPEMESAQFGQLCTHQYLSQGLMRLTEDSDRVVLQGYFNGLMAVPENRKAAVGRALNEATLALDEGCGRIRARLERLGVEAQAKLSGFDQNVAAFKGLMRVAIVERLTAGGASDNLNARFTGVMEQAEAQFDAVLNVDRDPWLRQALNAVVWAVAVAVSIVFPPLGLWVGAAIQSRHEATGDYGFFSRTESSAMAHVTNRTVKRILEQNTPDAPEPDNAVNAL